MAFQNPPQNIYIASESKVQTILHNNLKPDLHRSQERALEGKLENKFSFLENQMPFLLQNLGPIAKIDLSF